MHESDAHRMYRRVINLWETVNLLFKAPDWFPDQSNHAVLSDFNCEFSQKMNQHDVMMGLEETNDLRTRVQRDALQRLCKKAPVILARHRVVRADNFSALGLSA